MRLPSFLKPAPAPAPAWLQKLYPPDFMRSTLIFGSTGHGKSILLRHLAECVAASGCGMFFNSFKNDDADWVLGMLARVGRRDVVVFTPTSPASVNLLGAAVHGLDPASQAIRDAGVLADIGRAAARHKAGGGEDSFWELAADELRREACAVCRFAGVTPTPRLVRAVILTAARKPEDLTPPPAPPPAAAGVVPAVPGFHGGANARMLRRAWQRCEGGPHEAACRETVAFWTAQVPAMPDRQWAGVSQHAVVPLSLMSTGVLAEMLGSEKPTVDMAAAVAAGAVVVNAMSHAVYGKLYAAAARGLWTNFQQACLARVLTRDSVPCFSLIDELPQIVTPGDADYFALSRSNICPTVGAVQGIESLREALPGEADAAVEVIVGNAGLHLHCSPTPTTRKWLCDSLGNELRVMPGGSTAPKAYGDLASLFDQGAESSASWSTTYAPVLTPGDIRLRSGSDVDGRYVDALAVGPAHCRPYRVVTHRRAKP